MTVDLFYELEVDNLYAILNAKTVYYNLNCNEQIGDHYIKDLVDAIKNGEHFHLSGDNVKFMVKASHQRHESSKRMEHWFASAAII